MALWGPLAHSLVVHVNHSPTSRGPREPAHTVCPEGPFKFLSLAGTPQSSWLWAALGCGGGHFPLKVLLDFGSSKRKQIEQLRTTHTQTHRLCISMWVRMALTNTCRNSRIGTDLHSMLCTQEWMDWTVMQRSSRGVSNKCSLFVCVFLCATEYVSHLFGMCISFFDCLLSSSPPALHLCLRAFHRV